jgi:NAD-specific glutamate dehydrogenase
VRILKEEKGSADEDKTLAETWIDNHAYILAPLGTLFSDLRRSGTVDLPMLVIAEQKLRSISSL